MRYHDSVLDLIGNPPLVRPHQVTDGLRPTVLAKVEYVARRHHRRADQRQHRGRPGAIDVMREYWVPRHSGIAGRPALRHGMLIGMFVSRTRPCTLACPRAAGACW